MASAPGGCPLHPADDSRVMLCDNAPMATVRKFNTAGPVVAADHYCIPPLERIDLDAVLGLIRDKKYFVLHAPRQTGKTSALLALRDLLNGSAQGEFRCVYANVEAGQAMRDNVTEGMRTVLSQFALRASLTLGDDTLERVCSDAMNSAGPGGALNLTLSRWAAADRKPLVLLIDEIDSRQGAAQGVGADHRRGDGANPSLRRPMRGGDGPPDRVRPRAGTTLGGQDIPPGTVGSWRAGHGLGDVAPSSGGTPCRVDVSCACSINSRLALLVSGSPSDRRQHRGAVSRSGGRIR
jgi:hypothetical protein